MKRFSRIISIFVFFCCLPNIAVKAQQVQRQVAISAYIYNFAKNVEWQNEAQLKEFNFLIIGDDEKIIQEIRNMAKAKTIREKPIRITTADALTGINNVQLIFLLKGKEESLVKVFDQVEGKNILLVTDGYQDKKLIMINFFDSGKGTLQFEINKANILNQHLRIMQDMILLGGTEIDVAALYREGQQSLRTLQKHSDDLEKNLSQLEANLKQLQKTIVARNKEIEDSKDSLNRQSIKIQEQQKVLDSQSLLLKEREKELGDQILKIQEQQKIFALQTKDLEAQKSELEKGNKILQEQKADISKQKVEIDTQSSILEEQGMKIHKQQNLVYLLVIIILLVVVLVFSIYRGYQNKQQLNRQLENRVLERTNDLETSYKQLKIELAERKQAEKRLMESENKYRTLLENLPQKIFFKNSELVFVSCNENFAQELNITSSEIQGKTDYDFFPAELAEKYRKEDFDFLASGKPWETEIEEDRDGQIYWTQVVKIPVKDENGVVVGVQGIFWDITERKQSETSLKESEEKYRFLFERNPAPLLIYDDNTLSILAVNEAFLKHYGYSAKEVLAMTLPDLYPTEEKNPIIELSHGLYGHAYAGEWHHIKRDGSVISIIATSHDLVYMEREARIAVITDITERKQVEENLKTTNEELLVINRLITTCTSILDTNEMLDKVLLEALDIVGLEGGTICIIEPDDTLKLVASRETSEATMADLTENRIAVGNCLCGDCARTNCPLILPDRESVIKYSTREVLRNEEIQFHAAFPCTIKDKCIGIICVFTRTDNKPTNRNLKLLETLTSQVALAIENTQLFEKIQGYANELEKRVRERTSELEIRTNELARMNKVFVGREIRMAELKRLISELKNKNGNL